MTQWSTVPASGLKGLDRQLLLLQGMTLWRGTQGCNKLLTAAWGHRLGGVPCDGIDLLDWPLWFLNATHGWSQRGNHFSL